MPVSYLHLETGVWLSEPGLKGLAVLIVRYRDYNILLLVVCIMITCSKCCSFVVSPAGAASAGFVLM